MRFGMIAQSLPGLTAVGGQATAAAQSMRAQRAAGRLPTDSPSDRSSGRNREQTFPDFEPVPTSPSPPSCQWFSGLPEHGGLDVPRELLTGGHLVPFLLLRKGSRSRAGALAVPSWPHT